MEIKRMLSVLEETTKIVQEKGFWAERERLEGSSKNSLVLVSELALCMTELNEALEALNNEKASTNARDILKCWSYEKDSFYSECAGFLIRIHEVLTRNNLNPDKFFIECEDFLGFERGNYRAVDLIYSAIRFMLTAIDYARKLDWEFVLVNCELAVIKVLNAMAVTEGDIQLALEAELSRNQKRGKLHGKLA